MRCDPLLALQSVDARLHALRQRRADIPRSLSAVEKRVAEAKTAFDAFQAEVKKIRVEADRRNLDLKSREAKIVQLEGQLNQAKTNKEYAILKKEIDGHKADNGKVEEEILELYSAIEEKERAGKGVQDAFKAAEGELSAARTKAGEETATLTSEIEGLQKEREGVTAGIDADLLKTYQRILNGKPDGQAVVPAVNGVCQGCFMDLTSQEINLLLLDRDIQFCKSCSRILYIRKEQPAAAKK
jgi:predicted  nucleic acid-binding Zn-ribbon protein